MVIEGFPRRNGTCPRARRAGALFSTAPEDVVKFQGKNISKIYTDLTGVGEHGEIALYKPMGNPFMVFHYNGTWYDAAGGVVS